MNLFMTTRTLATALLLVATSSLMAVDCNTYTNPPCTIVSQSVYRTYVGCCDHTFSPYDFRCAEVYKRNTACKNPDPEDPDFIGPRYEKDWYPNPSTCSSPGCV